MGRAVWVRKSTFPAVLLAAPVALLLVAALLLLAALGACKRGDDAAEAVATDVPTDVARNQMPIICPT